MSIPVRHLPVIQNWDCHSCGNCCRELEVSVTDEERRRIEALGWDDDPELKWVRLFVRYGPWWARRTRLNHRPDGRCVFLSDDNRCRIHERAGADAKPLACRLFPFVLSPAGNHWRVGLRYSCPSAAEGNGRPLPQHETELLQATRLVEQAEEFEARNVPPPPLQRGQSVDWPDLLRFVQALSDLLADRRDRVERRLRKCLALAAICRDARFDKITGGKLVEFLRVVCEGLDAEVPVEPTALPRPGWVGRMLFRQLLAILVRKDRGENRGPATRNGLTRFYAAWRFTRGSGTVPRVNGFLPATTFAQVEAANGPLPPAAEEILERYYQVKVGSLQFCGPLNFRLPFWDGFASLAVTMPAILWLTRALADGPREQALARALSVVDDHFGYNRVLASRRVRFSLWALAKRGELERLIAWYSR
ncbi:MAG TPA: YkgJ family cysteine cluster protein [Gemmataceae bacterium]|nr:YkgJ family cysteine cluster protein [Gemmataceae bacterium]